MQDLRNLDFILWAVGKFQPFFKGHAGCCVERALEGVKWESEEAHGLPPALQPDVVAAGGEKMTDLKATWDYLVTT